MKKASGMLALLLLLCLPALYAGGLATEEATETEDLQDIVIDVQDGRMITGAFLFTLADMPEPIVLEVVDGEVRATIQTDAGEAVLSLGSGRLAVTQAAAPYVSVRDAASEETVRWTESERCDICDQPLLIGKHYLLECGHYGCLMTADHPILCSDCGKFRCNGVSHVACEHCGVALCIHVDLECEYMRNPAPTPYSTKTPDSATVYYHQDASGTTLSGDPSTAGSTKAPTAWTPGDDYVNALVTPEPD